MDTRLLASIIDLLPDATFAIDKDGIVIAWNRAIEIMTGVKRGEVLNKGDYIYAIPFYGVRRPILIDLVFKRDTEAETSYDYVKKNKTAIYAETFVPILNEGKGAYLWGTAAPIKDENNNYEGAIESIRDITSIKEARDALKASEEKYRSIFDAVNDAIIIYDTETNTILDVNKSMCEMFGYTYEKVLKTHLIDLITDISSEEEQDSINNFFGAIAKGPAQFQWKAKNKKNQKFWIEVHIHSALIGKDERILITIRDINNRKQIEQLMDQERQKFFTLIEEAPFGIVLFDRKGKYIYLNAKFKEIFGYDLSDIPDGRTWFRKAYPDPIYRHNVIRTWLNDVERFRQDPSIKESRQWIYTVTCKDHKQKIISFIVVSLPTGDYLLTLEDITEQKKAEEELQRKKAELDIKSANLEEVNAALKILLRERENDKRELEERILSNVKELVIPYIEKLKRCRLDPNHMTYVDIIETNLNDIISPFLQKMGLKYARLTPTELEVANLIKNGKRTKEISEILHISTGAINFHRNNIRKKLGLNKEKINLRSYLLSIK